MDYLDKNIWGTVIIFIIALIGYYYTPKQRGGFGYKTPMSLKNEATWHFANNLAKKLFVAVAIVFLILEVVFYMLLEEHKNAYQYSFLSLAVLSVSIIPIVELKLNQEFNKDGTRKN
ncbi:MAG: SdpI family protein [Cryomorphaceae bacterium]